MSSSVVGDDCTATSSRVSSSIPTEFVESFVVDAEMVSDLVENSDADLVGEFRIAEAKFHVGLVEDRDLIRRIPEVVDASFGQGDTLVDAEETISFGILVRCWPFLNDNDEIVDAFDDPLGEFGEDYIYHGGELSPVYGHVSHAARGRLRLDERIGFTLRA